MAKARIDIVGDAASFLRAIRLSRGETNEFRGDLTKLSASVGKTAAATVRAASVSVERQRAQIRAYRELAATAAKGSREQITASNLAAQAEGRLSRSIALTDREQLRAARNAGRFGRQVSRGAREGEGALRRLRRAFSFGIGVALGAGSIVEVGSIVKTATDAQAATGQFRQAAKDIGDSSRQADRALEAQLQTQRQLGFTNVESSQTMATLERATRNVTIARKAQLLVDNIARGRHIAIATAANAVARAYGGQTGALRRLVPFISKSATATEALQQADKAYAGSAVRYSTSAAGAQARVKASIDATEESISQALLPTITHLSNSISVWLSKEENQKRLQRDVATTFRDIATIAKVVLSIIRAGTPVVQQFAAAVGGTENAIKGLVAATLAWKAAKLIRGITGIGKAAETSKGEIVGLRLAMLALGGAGTLAALGAAAAAVIIIGDAIKDVRNNAKELQREIVLSQKDGTTVYGKNGHIFQQTIPYGGGQPVTVDITKTPEGRRYLRQYANALAIKNVSPQDRLNPRANVPGSPSYQTPSTAPPPKPGSQLTATQRNQLALASAKTDAAKLAALVRERQLLAAKIASIRRQLKTAKGAQADLLIADLQSAQQADTDAFTQIREIESRASNKRKAAAAAAAAAARAAARDYASSVATHALQLANAAASASAIAATRRAYSRLIAYYRDEAHDEKLTAAQRARYASDAIAARKRLVAQIIREKAAMDRATEAKQLGSLGISKGSSLDQLIQRIKDAAQAKEQGLTTSGKLGTPTVSALRTEAQQVAAALKGTYLDTNLSRNVLTKIRALLNGQLGRLNADMRGKIHQLLSALKGELTDFDGFNLTAAEKRRRSLDRRFADRYGGNHNRRTSTAQVSSQAPQYHWHFAPNVTAILDEPLGRALDRSFFKMRAAVGGTGG